MEEHEQLSFLNTFEGRKAPRKSLITKARKTVNVREKLALSPLRLSVMAANDRDFEQWESTNSKLRKAGLLARIAVRSSVSVVINAPLHVAHLWRNDSYHKQLVGDYPNASFMPAEGRGWEPSFGQVLYDAASCPVPGTDAS